MSDRRRNVSFSTIRSLKVTHRMSAGSVLGTILRFTEDPARVTVRNNDSPVRIQALGHLEAKDPIGVCISVAPDTCFDSNYEAALDVLDESRVATFYARGRTEIFACDAPLADVAEPEDVDLTKAPEPVVIVEPKVSPGCVDFAEMEPGSMWNVPFEWQGLTISPLGDSIRTSQIGDPPGITKIAFPNDGIRIEFAVPAQTATIVVNNYATPSLGIDATDAFGITQRFAEAFDNELRRIAIPVPGLVALEITGGGNESSLVEVCSGTPERT